MTVETIFKSVDIHLEVETSARADQAVYVYAPDDGAYLTAAQVKELIGKLKPFDGDPTTEVLHHNEWVSLMKVSNPAAGVSGYVYSHETRCQGRIVAVLPFRVIRGKRRAWAEFLLKSEVTPCWGMEQVVSAITGGYEGGDIEDDAVREMLEETGYAITRDELIPLGTCFASKSADTVYSLFAVDLTGREAGEAIGDGSRLESESRAVWLEGSDLLAIRDPQVSVMFLRACDTPEFMDAAVQAIDAVVVAMAA